MRIGKKEVIMPNMDRLAQQQRPVEYATKADVEVLAAEVRGFREATEARFEKVDARLTAHDQVLDRIERHLERIDRRFDDQAERHRATIRWIVGVAVALAGLILAVPGLILAILRFGQTGVG